MLGHLHHPLGITNNKKIKYNNCSIHFRKRVQAKGYRRVTINDGIINDVFIPLKPLRQLEIISGEYNDVINKKFM